MSACPSQGTAPSSSTTPAPHPFTLPEGSDPIRISDSVVHKVTEMLAEEGDPALRLRIFITGGGCAGFQYGFAFDDERQDDDLTVERGPLRVVVDAMSLQYLVGAEIDYEDKLDGARFVIRNPNAVSTCGCGSSFAV